MARVSIYSLPKEEAEKYLDDLFKAIASLEDSQKVEAFFRDLLTEDEILMLARRVQIALLLMKGWTYLAIVEEMHAGTPTVKRVDKWLNLGFGGYRNLLKRKPQQTGRGKPGDYYQDMDFTFDSLRHKYPAHFWLLNLLLDKE